MNDTQRLEFLIANDCYVSWSPDRDACSVCFKTGFLVEGYPQKVYRDPRIAIDAAVQHMTGRISTVRRFASAEAPGGFRNLDSAAAAMKHYESFK